jgi:hypothetical protein
MVRYPANTLYRGGQWPDKHNSSRKKLCVKVSGRLSDPPVLQLSLFMLEPFHVADWHRRYQRTTIEGVFTDEGEGSTSGQLAHGKTFGKSWYRKIVHTQLWAGPVKKRYKSPACHPEGAGMPRRSIPNQMQIFTRPMRNVPLDDMHCNQPTSGFKAVGTPPPLPHGLLNHGMSWPCTRPAICKTNRHE